MSTHKRNTSFIKRKALDNVTESYYNLNRSSGYDNHMPFTQQHGDNNSPTFERNFQNVNPRLPW